MPFSAPTWKRTDNSGACASSSRIEGKVRSTDGIKKIPEFKNEDEESEFWSATGEGADSTEYVDWSKARQVKFVQVRRMRHFAGSSRLRRWLLWQRISPQNLYPARRAIS